jgi:hypothetical protein
MILVVILGVVHRCTPITIDEEVDHAGTNGVTTWASTVSRAQLKCETKPYA